MFSVNYKKICLKLGRQVYLLGKACARRLDGTLTKHKKGGRLKTAFNLSPRSNAQQN
jgi:hypothetical protein